MTQFWRQDLESTLKADALDLWDWMSAVNRVPPLEQLNKDLAVEFTGQPAQDVFLSLYQDDPQLAESPPPSLIPLASIMRRLMDTPEWAKMQLDTRGQVLSSALGTKALSYGVLRSLPDEVKESARDVRAKAQQQERAQQQADDLAGLASKMRDQMTGDVSGFEGQGDGQEDQGGDGSGAEPDQSTGPGEQDEHSEHDYQEYLERVEHLQDAAQHEADYLAQQLQDLLDSFEETADQHNARIKAAFNDVAKEASNQAMDQAAFVKGFSEAAGGDATNVSPELVQAAMQALENNRYLQDLAEQLGWAQRVINAEQRMSPHGGTDLTGVTLGPLDVGRAVGQELVALAADEDSALFWDICRRIADSAVLLREYKGQEDEQGRGAMILVRDESGSMSGTSHSLAIGIEWALLQAARKDNRSFVSIPFSGRDQFSVWRAPERGKPDPDGLLAHLSHFYGGGTEPYGPLKKAIEIIQQDGLPADVLLISDAAFAQASDEFEVLAATAREQTPFRIEAVVIGGYPGTAEWADRLHLVRNLVADRDKLKEAFAGVVH